MKKCKDCGEELKYIAEGISKKGNRYEAFWGCKDKDCNYSEEPTSEEVKKYDLEARMNKMEEEQIKFKTMAWMNATNNAVEIFSRNPDTRAGGDGGKEISVDLDKIREFRNVLYKEHMEFFIRDIIEERD